MQNSAASLYDLLINVRRAIALNFDEPIWVKAEVAQRSYSNGHVYLSLVEKDETTYRLRAKADAAIWSSSLKVIRTNVQQPLNDLLAVGSEIAVLAEVTYHEVYGFKLSILDIDERYTLGQLELQRIETINRLKAKALIQRNEQVPMPMVWQRLAIISGAQAAGYSDFRAELAQNAAGYAVRHVLFQSAVQGERVRENVISRLEEISLRKAEFDLILILRGGGSKMDLRGFDDFQLCEAIANCPLPVLTGIGHETDHSIADMVAAISVKTPTAAAHLVIDNLRSYEEGLLQGLLRITDLSTLAIRRAAEHMTQSEHKIKLASQLLVKNAIDRCQHWMLRISQGWQSRLQHEIALVRSANAQLDALDPKNTLRRGYTMTTTLDDRIIKSPEDLQHNQEIITHWSDHKVTSQVSEVQKK